MINIKLLMIILDSGYSKKIKYMLNKYGIKVKIATTANGTASPSILTYFGLEETKKEVFMSIIPDYLSNKIISRLKKEFNLNNFGTGIAFTIPISSANKYLSDSFAINTDGSENMEKNSDEKYHLVLTIVSEGYLEQVMNSAKKAGSSGGTVIKGRALNNTTKERILGFNIEPEKDIVLNIVTEKDKTRVMEAITKEVGIKTPGKGICISLPVDEAIGIDPLNK